MAHFAELDDTNTVLQVIVVHNNELLDENGQESEAKGIAFCQSLFGGKWVQTSYNGNFRKHYAAKNYIYDSEKDVFIPPQPYPSWILNENTIEWECPIPTPTDGLYNWNEELQQWEKINE